MFIAFFLSFLAIGFYTLGKLGIHKSWFIMIPSIAIATPNHMFAMLPIGVAMLYMSIMASLPNYDPDDGHVYVFVAISFLGLVFLFWQPDCIKPKWIIWLEKKYGYIKPILIEDGRTYDRWQWESMVRTQVGLQQWIDSVVKKHADEEKARWILYKFTKIAKHYDFKNKPSRNYQVGDSVPLDLVPEHRRFDRTIISMDEYKLFIAVDRYFEETGEYSVLRASSN